jgi:hypothetical protein
MPTITKRPSTATRLRWRVVVGTQGLDPSRPSRPLAWHLADCRSPALAEAHCARGRELLAEGADPDGHCLTEGAEICPRCANITALAALLEAAATPPPPATPPETVTPPEPVAAEEPTAPVG